MHCPEHIYWLYFHQIYNTSGYTCHLANVNNPVLVFDDCYGNFIISCRTSLNILLNAIATVYRKTTVHGTVCFNSSNFVVVGDLICSEA